MAAAMETVAAAAALLALRLENPAVRARLSPLWALAVVPTMVGMTAPHAQTGGHAHAPRGHPVAVGAAADPVFAGLDTSHASETELEAAGSLIERTRRSVSARFPDEAGADGGRVPLHRRRFPTTRHEHFINASYLADGRELDPERVESVVMEGMGVGARIVSAMYILETGKTMADVPTVAGPLATWHDHQNLCWDPSGTRLAGVLLRGRCVPGGTLRATPPMLHVWLEAHECGPFAGIEGHGSACDAGHDQ